MKKLFVILAIGLVATVGTFGLNLSVGGRSDNRKHLLEFFTVGCR